MPKILKSSLMEGGEEISIARLDGLPVREMPVPSAMDAIPYLSYFRIPKHWKTAWAMQELQDVRYEDAFHVVVVNPNERYVQRMGDWPLFSGVPSTEPGTYDRSPIGGPASKPVPSE